MTVIECVGLSIWFRDRILTRTLNPNNGYTVLEKWTNWELKITWQDWTLMHNLKLTNEVKKRAEFSFIRLTGFLNELISFFHIMWVLLEIRMLVNHLYVLTLGNWEPSRFAASPPSTNLHCVKVTASDCLHSRRKATFLRDLASNILFLTRIAQSYLSSFEPYVKIADQIWWIM